MWHMFITYFKNLFYKGNTNEAHQATSSRTIREFNYLNLLDSYSHNERRRFYDLDMLSILNQLNYTQTNAGEQYLLQHFLQGTSINKQSITEADQQLLQQIGYSPSLNLYDFFNQNYQSMLPQGKKLAYSLYLLPVWLVLSYFYKQALILLFIQLLINYIISLYYEERLGFIREHLNYLLNMNSRMAMTSINHPLSEATLSLSQRLKHKPHLFGDHRSMGSEIVLVIVGVRKLLLLNVLEITKYYQLFMTHKDQFQDMYAYIAALDLAHVRESCLKNLEVVESSNNTTFHIVEMAHPLIKDFKKYTIDFEQSMLVTGTNASGKSIFLKTMGVNLLFANVLGIAFATQFSVPKLDIVTYIDIKDNLFDSESLFVAELQITKQILQQKTHLAIIDEPFRGTNAKESAALVYGLIKTFQEENRHYLISTHHKALAYEDAPSRRYYFDEHQEKYHLYRGVTQNTNAVLLANEILAGEQVTVWANAYLSRTND